MRSVIQVFRILLLLVIFVPSSRYVLAQNQNEKDLQDPQKKSYPLSVNATFTYGSLNKIVYTSRWRGILSSKIYSDSTNKMFLEICTGLGTNPSELVSIWYPVKKSNSTNNGENKITLCTAPLQLCLTSNKVTEQQLNRWITISDAKNPALTISLVPSQDNTYLTNDKPVTGSVFILTNTKNGTRCRLYSGITIPAKNIKLTVSSGQDKTPVYTLTIQYVLLNNVLPRTWLYILSQGNKHLYISPTSHPGKSYDFSAEPPQTQPTFVSEHVIEFKRNILDLYTAGSFDLPTVKEIMKRIDNLPVTGRNIPTENIVNVESILKNTGSNNPDLQPDIDQLLIETNSILSGTIARHTDSSYTPSTPYERTSWYIDDDADPLTATGEIDHPFRSIADALEEAENENILGLNLYVDNGVYREPLEITRDTVIIAFPGTTPLISGSIVNNTPALLAINGFLLSGAGYPGAIYVNNEDAKTWVINTQISGATGFGFYQKGGEANLDHVEIMLTRCTSAAIWSGSGAVFTDGIEVFLNDVSSSSNESHGMVIEGNGTCAWGDTVTISGNHFNRYFRDVIVEDGHLMSSGTGALEIRDYAQATLYHLCVLENEIEGLYVHTNAEVTVSNAEIARMRIYVLRQGGFGVRVRSGGHLTMTNFIVSHCDVAGFIIASEGQLDLHIGEVFSNPIGVGIPVDVYDLGRLSDRVLYHDNERNLDTFELPVPDTDVDF